MGDIVCFGILHRFSGCLYIQNTGFEASMRTAGTWKHTAGAHAEDL